MNITYFGHFFKLREAQSVVLLSLFDFKIRENSLTSHLVYYNFQNVISKIS